jgi:hypothetical protein
MSEEIVYSNLTSKSSCPDGYYTVNIGGTDTCCSTPDCTGYGFGVNPKSGGIECCEPLPPFIEVRLGGRQGFSFSCATMNWVPNYCDYLTIAYPTIEECYQKRSEAETWIYSNPGCPNHDIYNCGGVTGGFPLDDGISPPEMPTQEDIDLYYCPPENP